ncbi:hypothetical protein, partial [Bordetella pertussis]|uniref:hypothetical protein n=1 Tax=Bordetella pertussis TaxID=520 RepID=UPI0012B21C12
VAERLDAAMRELDALPESQRDAAAPAAAIGRIQRVQSRKVLQDNLYSLAGATARPDGLQGRQRGNGIMLGLAREVSAGLSL